MKNCIDRCHRVSGRQPGLHGSGATQFENGFQDQESAIVLRYRLALNDVLRWRQAEGLDCCGVLAPDTRGASTRAMARLVP